MRLFCMLAVATLLASAAGADLIFNQEVAESGTLISDKAKQFEVGDLITVLVQETVDASTTADTDTRKESEIESEAAAAENEFLVADNGLNIFNPAELPNFNIEFEREHRAQGETRRANRLIMTVACRVKEIQPNNNLLIEGEKKVTVNREDSMIKVKGVIRARDVTPANTISSHQIAEADIELKGQGPLWNNQRRGILTKILDWFSPF
jgi:flagellar L-ring protein precursor FlgH